MAQNTPTLYVSVVATSPAATWRALRVPAEVPTAHGTLLTSGLAFGTAVGPHEAGRGAHARLAVFPRVLGGSVDVEIELSPWSDDRIEVGIRPRGRLPLLVSERRYRQAVKAVLDELASELELQGIMLAASTARASV